MSLAEFVNASVGGRIIDLSLPVEPGPEWRYQCVSLIKEYLRKVFGLQPGAWGDAVDYWRNPRAELLVKFYKVGPPYVPGDIVIVRKGTRFEHIGIALEGDRLLEQNGGLGTGSGLGSDAIRIVKMPTATYGALRPKGENMYPNEGDIHNAYLDANGRRATPQEVATYTSKPWSASDGLLQGKIRVDFKNSKDAQAEQNKTILAERERNKQLQAQLDAMSADQPSQKLLVIGNRIAESLEKIASSK